MACQLDRAASADLALTRPIKRIDEAVAAVEERAHFHAVVAAHDSATVCFSRIIRKEQTVTESCSATTA